MQRWVPPPADLRACCDGGVVVHTPAALEATCFPALVGSMLVLRLAGQVQRSGHGPLPAAALIGPSTGPSQYAHQGAVHAVGLLIRPEALAAVLGAPGGLLVDRHLDLADLPDPAGMAWQGVAEALRSASDDDARLGLLFSRLRRVVDGPQQAQLRTRLQHLALALQGPLPEACRSLGLSRRQLERWSRTQFGMTPKQFQTIARLQQALHGAAQAPGADLAVQAGYYDQSHLARDLRRLVGQPLRPLVQAVQQAGQADAADRQGTAHWPLAVGWQLSG